MQALLDKFWWCLDKYLWYINMVITNTWAKFKEEPIWFMLVIGYFSFLCYKVGKFITEHYVKKNLT